MAYSIGLVCSVGVGPERGGRSHNEDNYLICQEGRISYRVADGERTERADGAGVLLAVCDGMGGHEQGDLASTVAVRVMAKLYASGRPRDPDRALHQYVLDAHRRLHQRAVVEGRVSMGTTLTACWVLGGYASWVQVGDSRLYLYRDGRLECLTPDHTQREFARRDGVTEGEEAGHLAQNFIFGSRGLGDDAELRLESGRDSGRVPLARGDRILLCTDGLWGAVDDVSVADVLRHTPDPQAAAVACMERAIARGSTDNISVIVARVEEPTENGL
ncbi:MAG: serine/threonine-protein phosphatase [Deltaproteobacteria bacterium]|nr:serine/threonine-protein phosphatase [Deltaproteobacteria bacterium]MBW2253827.1 serine/threonine-protein phosphatase [Deltaproteobacteria bacterium]